MASGRSSLEIINSAWQGALDTLFPIECLGCKQEGEWVCQRCARKIALSPQETCVACQKTSPAGKTCFACQKIFPLTRLIRFFDYDDLIIKEGIRIAKYSFVPDIFESFVAIASEHLLAAVEAQEIDPRALLFVPVPLHPRRLRERGFNQAELIAKIFAQSCGAKVEPALRRARYTLAQADLGEADRMQNIKQAFVCSDKVGLENRYAVLVDDVATTGSTLAECARALDDAGAREVWGMVLAKG